MRGLALGFGTLAGGEERWGKEVLNQSDPPTEHGTCIGLYVLSNKFQRLESSALDKILCSASYILFPDWHFLTNLFLLFFQWSVTHTVMV